MAFNINYLGRVSTSGNTDALKVWTYNGTDTGSDETESTISASGYFNDAQQNLTSGEESGLIQVGDVIHIHGNDASGMYIFDSITTNVTVSSYAAIGTVDTAQIAADAVTNPKIADDAVSLENLDSDIAPSHIVKFADQVTSTGGAASEDFTVTGALTSDLCFVQLEDDGSNNVTVLYAAIDSADTLTVVFSADPGNDAVINYQLLRAAA